MSAGAVRSQIRTWAAEVATSTGVPFYDTVNVEVNPTENVWWTVEFNAEFHEGTFCEPGYIEQGFIDCIVIAQPGRGDTAAIAALEQIVPTLMAKTGSKVELVSYEPIGEMTNGSADQTYRVRSIINYAYSL